MTDVLTRIWRPPHALDGYSGPIYYLPREFPSDHRRMFWRPNRCPETESRQDIDCKIDDPRYCWPSWYLRVKYRDMVRAAGLNYRQAADLMGRSHQTARAWACPSRAISQDTLDLLEYRLRRHGYLGAHRE